MKMIPLTQGKHAMVDDEDYDFLMQWKWRVLRAKRKKMEDAWYAYRTTDRPNRKSVYMHREVVVRSGFPNAPQCDHVDGDGLNNQRNNLRPATASQNRWNMRKRPGCASRFKGVSLDKKLGKWQAKIHHEGHHRYLGLFEKEEDAARAYDAAAVLYFGEFGFLNFNPPQ